MSILDTPNLTGLTGFRVRYRHTDEIDVKAEGSPFIKKELHHSSALEINAKKSTNTPGITSDVADPNCNIIGEQNAYVSIKTSNPYLFICIII